MSSIWSEETSPEGITCVDLVDGDVAALLGGLDHLLDAGIGEIEQRGLGTLLLQHLYLLPRYLDLACHGSPQSTLS